MPASGGDAQRGAVAAETPLCRRGGCVRAPLQKQLRALDLAVEGGLLERRAFPRGQATALVVTLGVEQRLQRLKMAVAGCPVQRTGGNGRES